MTSYSDMAARGRAEAAERAKGRRKRRAVEVRRREVPRQEWVPPSPPFSERGFWRDSLTGRVDYVHEIVGDCGHVLDWRRGATPEPPSYWPGVVERGRRYTCGHDDCKVEPKPEVPDAERCEYVMGVDFERRCPTRSRYETGMGRACRKHRDWWLREGYIDEDEKLI